MGIEERLKVSSIYMQELQKVKLINEITCIDRKSASDLGVEERKRKEGNAIFPLGSQGEHLQPVIQSRNSRARTTRRKSSPLLAMTLPKVGLG